MKVLGAHSYDTLVELKKEEYHEKKLKRWWGTRHSFGSFLEAQLLFSIPS